MNQLFTGISPKDTTYVSDIISELLVLNKKIAEYEKDTVDEQIKEYIYTVRQMTVVQYKQLLEVLQNG